MRSHGPPARPRDGRPRDHGQARPPAGHRRARRADGRGAGGVVPRQPPREGEAREHAPAVRGHGADDHRPQARRAEGRRRTRRDVAALHAELAPTPYMANRVLTVLRAMFGTPNARSGARRTPTPASASTSTRGRARALVDRRRVRGAGRRAGPDRPRGLPPRRGGAGAPRRRRRRPHAPAAAHAGPVPLSSRCRAGARARGARCSGPTWTPRAAWRSSAPRRRGGASGRSARRAGRARRGARPSRSRGPPSPYVFPGAGGAGVEAHRSNVRPPWARVRKAAGLAIRLHDLRHSFTIVARASATVTTSSPGWLATRCAVASRRATATSPTCWCSAPPTKWRPPSLACSSPPRGACWRSGPRRDAAG
jgi:hypothetical protein